MSGATVQAVAGGGCAVAGQLGFETVPALWRTLREQGLLASAQSVDLSGVTASDSAGLAMLVAWRAAREAGGGRLRFESVPGRLQALARLTEAQSLLEG